MRRLKYVVLSILTGAALVSGCGDVPEDGQWRGRIEVVAGVSRVISDAPIRHSPDQTADVNLIEDVVIDGRAEGIFSSVFGVTTDKDGNIYVADAAQKQILKFSDDGSLLASVGSEGVGPLQFSDSNRSTWSGERASSIRMKPSSSNCFR